MSKLLRKIIIRSLALSATALLWPGITARPYSRPWIAPTPITANSSAQDSSVSVLTPDQPVQGELASGKSHSYRIDLSVNQYIRLLVEPKGIEASVVLYGPKGESLIEINCRREGLTPLSLIASVAGTYRLEIRSLEKYTATGHYEARIEQLRPATPQDRSRIAAEKLFAEAEDLQAQWTAEARRRAIRKYEEALLNWKTAGEPLQAAHTLKVIGQVHQQLNEPQVALKYYEQALQLSRSADDRRGEAEAINEIGYAQLSLGKNQEALENCTKALALNRSVGNRRGEAQTLNNIGEAHYFLGELQKALSYYQQALSLWRDLGDRRGQAQSLLYLGYSYADLGEVQKALDSYEQARSLWRTVNDIQGQALTLSALGNLYNLLGERQKALSLYYEAMPLFRPLDDKIGEARTLIGIGFAYDKSGEKRRAIEYYNQALGHFRSASYRDGEASALWRIGGSYYALGDYVKALEYYQPALLTLRAIANKRMESWVLKDLGMVYEAKGDKTRALEYYRQALSLIRAEEDRRGKAHTLNNIGSIYLLLGEKQKALDNFNEALELFRAVDDRSGESQTLYNIARLERSRDHLNEARSQVEASLKIIESLRMKVANQDLRASYFASIHQRYEFYINLLMQLHQQRPAEGFAALALQASERARARSLLETLAEDRIRIRQGVDPQLLEQEHALQQALTAKVERRIRLLSGKHTEEEVRGVAKEIDELTVKYDDVEAQIRAASPRYAALTQPQPLSVVEIQQQVLDDETLMLEYSLGDEKSYLWAVTRSSFSSYELPATRSEIESAVHRIRELLLARQPVQGETALQYRARVAKADTEYWPAAARLSDLLLGPVAAQLRTKRLLMVTEGALQYAPFAGLPVPSAQPAGDCELAAREQSGKLQNLAAPLTLINDHEIINMPSASAFAVLRSENRGRQLTTKTVAILADPVFESDDPRLQRGRSLKSMPQPKEHAGNTELRRTLRDAGLLNDKQSLPRLLSSRQEANAIMAVAPAGTGMQAVDFKASRALALSPELSRYRIVHFATHSIFNGEHPELSGIVLSLVDERGRPQEGFLRLHDIYNLNLPAELVVLSACNTGLGKDIRGEGMVGLARGFMYAGAARVVASLWKVDDEATAELMKRFYERILRDKLPPAAALKAALVEMQGQKRWQAPYYWAGFVLQGEWR